MICQVEIKIAAKEVRGPKVGVPENIIEGFMRSHQITKKDLFEKIEEKGKFYCFKKLAKKIQNRRSFSTKLAFLKL